MKNLVFVVGTLLVLIVCWFTLREIRVCQEKMDMLVAKVDAMSNGVSACEEYEDKPIIKEKEEEIYEKEEQIPERKVEQPKKEVAKAEPVTEVRKQPVSQPTPQREEIKREINANDIVVTQFKKNHTDSEEIITFKNNTSSSISRIQGILVYKDMSGNDISYSEIDIRLSIAPEMSKQTKIKSFDQDHKYCYYKEYQSYMDVVGVSGFKIEFRLVSYN